MKLNLITNETLTQTVPEPELDIRVSKSGNNVIVKAGRWFIAVFQVEDGKLKLRLPSHIEDSNIAVDDEGRIELSKKYI